MKKYKEEGGVSLPDILIAMLGSARNTRVFHQIIRDRQFKRYTERSVRSALTRLHRKKYVDNIEGSWYTTPSGKKYLESKDRLDYFTSPFPCSSPSNTILSYDIPEASRSTRNWLRNQIKIFGYKILQQSLWIGPGPLPKNFFERLKDLGIRKNVKIFTLK